MIPAHEHIDISFSHFLEKRGEQYRMINQHPHIFRAMGNGKRGLMPSKIDSFAVSRAGNLDRMVRAEPDDVDESGYGHGHGHGPS